MTDSINTRIFEGKVRVRVCGLLIENDRLLLLKHKGLGTKGFLWSPPGGGVNFGENSSDSLEREFLEETGLAVSILKFLFINEYRSSKYHAIELFFEVKRESGEVSLGSDPEMPSNDQLLEAYKWFSVQEIQTLNNDNLHNIFHHVRNFKQLTFQSGFFNFEDISLK